MNRVDLKVKYFMARLHADLLIKLLRDLDQNLPNAGCSNRLTYVEEVEQTTEHCLEIVNKYLGLGQK